MRRAWIGVLLVLTACGTDHAAAPPDVASLAATVTAQTSSRGTAHVAFQMDGGTSGEGVYRTSPTLAADFTTTGPDGQSRFILLDKTIYLRPPARDWMRLP